MVLTLSTCAALVRHALRGRDLPPDLSPVTLVNLAGRWFVTAHPWTWLERPATGLDFVAGQTYCDLPTDFGELRSVEVDNLVSRFNMTSSAVLNEMRTANVDASGLVFWGSLVYGAGSATSAPTVRLDIYPTPNANETDALSLYYRAGWSELTNDSSAAQVPAFCEPAFVETIRAFARGYEYNTLPDEMAALRMGAIREAVDQDMRQQSDFGPIMNGASACEPSLPNWGGYQLADPS
jgi:hypothetical protein